MKALRVDFAQPGAAVHQATSPSPAPNQCSGLGSLAGQVALRVDDAARLAGRARGEDDRRRVLGRRGRPIAAGVSWARSSSKTRASVVHVHVGDAVGQLAQVAGLADAELRLRGPRAQLEVLAAQLRVAGQDDGAHPPAGEHRQHPLGPAADQGHHDVAALDAAGREGAGEAGRAGEELAEVVHAARAVGGDLDQRRPRRGKAFDHVLDEVHARQSAAQRGESPG